jgi:hypothetical protein
VSVVPLLRLPTGAMALIDANIFIYAFRERSAQLSVRVCSPAAALRRFSASPRSRW